MAGNYLEQLVAQWYEYQGYFVRQNVFVGKRPKGGYECELDIVAYHPSERKLVHIEPSMDADSWANRERRFRKKFEAGRKYIPTLFEGFTLPDKIEQIAVLVFASKVNHQEIGGGRLVLIQEILTDIFYALHDQKMASSAIPEHLPILRSFQLVSDYRKAINEIWSERGDRMAHPHGGDGNTFTTKHSFAQAFSYVGPNGVSFRSTTGEQIFARHGKTRDGNIDTIVFMGERNRHGSVCEACWGYRIDCNGSRIGQCAEALDDVIT